MNRLPTVLLHHRSRSQSHYDWLLAMHGDERLWTARVFSPSACWLARGRIDLEPLGMHRRRYLTYEGPLSGGRGEVRQIDAGWHTPRLWAAERIVTRVCLSRCQVEVDIRRVSADRWVARVRPPT